MKKNIGNLDRNIRIVIGVLIIAAGFYFQSYWGFVGIIPLVTAFIRWCPLYAPFRLSTKCKADQAPHVG